MKTKSHSLEIYRGLYNDYRFISEVKDILLADRDKKIAILECRISGLLLRESLRN